MGPPERGASIPFRVLVDGEPPGDAHGLDVDEEGRGSADRQRLYQLVREPGPIDDRTFEIAFDAPGVEANVFTFG
jgi:thioredoxin family protein